MTRHATRALRGKVDDKRSWNDQQSVAFSYPQSRGRAGVARLFPAVRRPICSIFRAAARSSRWAVAWTGISCFSCGFLGILEGKAERDMELWVSYMGPSSHIW